MCFFIRRMNEGTIYNRVHETEIHFSNYNHYAKARDLQKQYLAVTLILFATGLLLPLTHVKIRESFPEGGITV